MAKRTDRRRLLRVLALLVILLCVLMELGQRFPSFPFPGWDDVFGGADLTPAPVAEGTLEVHIIDVGNADCILVRQGGSNMLIDAGEKGDADTILEYLRRQRVEKLDLVVATHSHADHIGGMAKVIKNVAVDRFIMAFMPEKDTPTTAGYLNMLEALDEKGVPVDEAQPGAVYTLGTAQLKLLAPLEETSDSNNMSVVSLLSFGKRRFLFMGDAEAPSERLILSSGADVRADVLKAGHHGSSTASSEVFVRAVSPSYAVLTCGKGNSYGHPHSETLAMMKQYQISVCRSDVCGHIVFTSDGTSLDVTKEKE